MGLFSPNPEVVALRQQGRTDRAAINAANQADRRDFLAENQDVVDARTNATTKGIDSIGNTVSNLMGSISAGWGKNAGATAPTAPTAPSAPVQDRTEPPRVTNGGTPSAVAAPVADPGIMGIPTPVVKVGLGLGALYGIGKVFGFIK